MFKLSQQEHAVQQIDECGAMIGISRQWYEEAKEKLAAYEDAAEQRRLVIFDDEEGFATGERLAEIMLAEHDKRLIVLPCKIGADIYTISGHLKKVFKIKAMKEDMLTKIIPIWNKVYFATEPEARKALDGMK